MGLIPEPSSKLNPFHLEHVPLMQRLVAEVGSIYYYYYYYYYYYGKGYRQGKEQNKIQEKQVQEQLYRQGQEQDKTKEKQ